MLPIALTVVPHTLLGSRPAGRVISKNDTVHPHTVLYTPSSGPTKIARKTPFRSRVTFPIKFGKKFVSQISHLINRDQAGRNWFFGGTRNKILNFVLNSSSCSSVSRSKKDKAPTRIGILLSPSFFLGKLCSMTQ